VFTYLRARQLIDNAEPVRSIRVGERRKLIRPLVQRRAQYDRFYLLLHEQTVIVGSGIERRSGSTTTKQQQKN
jgi:hypothetical protein